MHAVPATVAAAHGRRRSSINASSFASVTVPRRSASIRSAASITRLNRSKPLVRVGSFQDLIPAALPTANVRKDAEIYKLCAGEVWQPRRCVLTNEVFVCAKPATSDSKLAVVDDIPLYAHSFLSTSLHSLRNFSSASS